MAKIEHVHHRLERWALWVHRARSGPLCGGTLAMFSGYRPEHSGPREAPIPINEEECLATERAIMQLADPLPLTVCSYYLHDSCHTRKTLSISPSVLCQRIDRAHRELEIAFRKPPSPDAGKLQSWCAELKKSFTP